MTSTPPSTDLSADVLPQPFVAENPGRYTQEQAQRICQLLAHYMPFQAMKEMMWQEHRRAFPFTHYVWFRRAPDWQPLITNLRQQYLSHFDDIPIAQKRVRLERLERLYEETKGVQLKVSVLRAASEELRDPTMGSQTNIAITAYYQMSASELEQKRVDLINKLRHLRAQEKAEGSAGGSHAIIEA